MLFDVVPVLAVPSPMGIHSMRRRVRTCFLIRFGRPPGSVIPSSPDVKVSCNRPWSLLQFLQGAGTCRVLNLLLPGAVGFSDNFQDDCKIPC